MKEMTVRYFFQLMIRLLETWIGFIACGLLLTNSIVVFSVFLFMQEYRFGCYFGSKQGFFLNAYCNFLLHPISGLFIPVRIIDEIYPAE